MDPLTSHLCVRSVKYDFSSRNAFPVIPTCISFCYKTSWSTVSKAFFKSINTTKLSNFLSMLMYQSFVQSIRAEAVTWNFLKPN